MSTDPEEATPRPHRRLILTRADKIKPKRVRWLWLGRLALGTLAILAGREGAGKSTIAYWLAAQVTTGTLPGDLQGTPAAVLVVATEDSWEHTIAPRLAAAGADEERVYRIEVSVGEVGQDALSLPVDITLLYDAITSTGAALVLLDPLLSRLSANLDTHNDQKTRLALDPLAGMLDTTGAACLGLMHFNKSESKDLVNTVMGSRAFTSVARSVSVVIRDDQDPTGAGRLFATPKNNLGPEDLPWLPFMIESCEVFTDEGAIPTSRIVWGEEVAHSIPSPPHHIGRSKVQSAEGLAAEWLIAYLTEQGGQASSKSIKQSATAAGHSTTALARARNRLALLVTSHGHPRSTTWHLPGDPVQPPTTAASGGLPTTATAATTAPTGSSHGSHGSGGSPDESPNTHPRPDPPDACNDCGRPLDGLVCWECTFPDDTWPWAED